MSKIAQISILILFLLLGGSVFMVLNTLSQKQALEKQKTTLEGQLNEAQIREAKLIKDSKDLADKLKATEEAKAKVDKDLEGLNEQLGKLNDEVSSISKERDQWKDRMGSIRKERDDLMAKLQAK